MDNSTIEISPEGKQIMFHMIKELSHFTHAFRNTVVGCYRDVVIQRTLSAPESEDEIVDAVIDFMNQLEKREMRHG